MQTQSVPNKEYHHQYYVERRERLKKAHLCLQCKTQDERTLMGYCHCAKCSEQARLRNERKKKMSEKLLNAIGEMVKILKDSPAVIYEPNAHPLECVDNVKNEFFVTADNGHLTINYETLAKALYNASYRKQSEGEWRSEIRERRDWRGKKQKYFQPNSCSVCHEAVAERTPFCPNCGAKMKGGEK